MIPILHQWFLENLRSFPWREDPTPYRVWISEVMLQQTRASVVVPYFERWMLLFPNIETLANASLEEVIKAWEGLGYYKRARNLHAGAKQIIEEFGGEIPNRKEALETIRGLGPYTVNAILSFGFHQNEAPVDGNVTRVIARLFAIEKNVSKQAVKREISEKAKTLLDEKKPWISAEALIELGASLCTPKPKCSLCPLAEKCLAHSQGKADYLPIKNRDPEITYLERTVFVIMCQEMILVKQEKGTQVMAGLYQFPYVEGKEVPQIEFEKKLKKVKHSFTRYQVTLYPLLLKAPSLSKWEDCEWVSLEKVKTLPFSSGHRRVLLQVI